MSLERIWYANSTLNINESYYIMPYNSPADVVRLMPERYYILSLK